MSILIQQATIILPDRQTLLGDVYIQDGKIAAIAENLDPNNLSPDAQPLEIIDATGLTLMAGAIDPQVHFREPGLEHKEDLRSASHACAKGGVTSFLEMPNTRPLTITQAALDDKLSRAASKCVVNYGFFIGATGEVLPDLLSANPTCGIKIFMGSMHGALLVDQEEVLDEDYESEEEEEEEEQKEDDLDSDEESGSNGFSNGSNNSDSKDNESLSSSDFSDMIREQMQKNLDRENKNIDDFNSENEVSENSIDSLKTSNDSEDNFLDILKLIDYVPEDYINKINSNSEFLDDFLKYNNSKMKSKQSKIVDISRYISILTSKKKKGKIKKGLNQNSRTFYSVIASKNNKNIVSLVNFFKLKFQDKEKSKRFFNKEKRKNKWC